MEAGTRQLDSSPWAGFEQAAAAAVEVLQTRLGMDVWLVTRVRGEDQIVVAAYPSAPLPVGTVLSWEQAFCRRMVAGEGPRMAPVVAAVPAYANARQGFAAQVAAYVGVPLHRPDGSLYGTVCAFSARAQPVTLSRQLPLVELVAGLLATVLAGESGQEP